MLLRRIRWLTVYVKTLYRNISIFAEANCSEESNVNEDAVIFLEGALNIEFKALIINLTLF